MPRARASVAAIRLATAVPWPTQSRGPWPVRSMALTRPASWGLKSTPLSTTATVTPWPRVTVHAPAMSRACWAHGSSRSLRTPSCGGHPRAGRGSTWKTWGETGVGGGAGVAGGADTGAERLADGVADAVAVGVG